MNNNAVRKWEREKGVAAVEKQEAREQMRNCLQPGNQAPQGMQRM